MRGDLMEQKMERSLQAFTADLAAMRAGRANPSVLDKVMIDYYGTSTPITQVATVSAPEPRMLTVSPYDVSTLGELEKAILKADIGLNPNNDGKILRLAFPPLTEERRREIVKDVHKRAEEAKVSIRSMRRDGMDACKAQLKAKEITEDDAKFMEKELETLTSKKIREIEEITNKKEKEILEV
ncbi:MAG: ribosome recycling factor [Clostridiales bacterium]|nr:ribosome recycling factor [Clostridiales bacterium]